ncbi:MULTISPECIES: polynucleotide adenylyltransferase PcnB [Halomonas]|uniref:Poly(A) polymerase I n=2 Tax=Halomonas TaxID=2745 RepID=A0ABQ0U3K0_9GAMM|nr:MULTISPECIES: polynucleotide adenylyltransferase PcnB [Halomonas]PSJ20801.1 polynucleotide adenylyltransferase PcnB [Halomonas sp. ND22Bw]KGE79254.1 poly(A) polymerase [Halomonas salina]MDR5889351.1 polynucleotide adenylyltransferase PcnB [Halomonas salina]WJY07096.1 polynucleotide adenylyltransferase PcnB [Halomonas halophila]GEK73103.1 poly(A) polymerase I [Halomonas halophila]
MIKGFTRFLQSPGERLRSLFGPQEPSAALPELRIIPRDEHPVSRQHFSDAALKVLYRLHNAGHEAFLVGGCIRDSLLGRMPKDFDVATDATPEQVRELFRNSRIVGRRFRIVHVRFGREVIEVTTFRGKPSDDHADHIAQQSDDGMLLRDNVWGNIEEDAIRRDFTINALYYNIADFSIHDFAGGVQDIEDRTLRLIGDPATRYREDPVRMLRAVRFAAKLDFDIAPATEAPIAELAELLLQVPPARLFDEVLKLFMSGHGVETFHLLRDYGLFAMLFPEADEAMEELPWAEAVIERALTSTDRRVRDDRPVTPAFLFAALLWGPVQLRQQALEADGMPPIPAQQAASQQVISRQLQHVSIPKRFSLPMRDIWDLQQRLPLRRGKRVFQTREHPRFRAAYDFLLVREAAGEMEPGLGDWWTAFQDADEHEQRRLLGKVDADPAGTPAPRNKRRRRRRRRKPSNDDS